MSSTNNPLLLQDILQPIFELLPLRDKKTTRLVCKVWLEVNNRRKFTSKQAFFLPNMYDYGTIVDVLANCKWEHLNLKFDQSLIDDDSLLLWKTCGGRIEYLNFNKCIFQNGIIPAVLENCANLINLRIRGGQFLKDHETFYTKLGSFPIHDFEPIYEDSLGDILSVASFLLPTTSMVHEKLVWLHLDSSALKFRSSDLQRVASAFPGLRCLKMKMVVNDDLKAERKSDETPNLSALFELLAEKKKDLVYLDLKFQKTNFAGRVTLEYLVFNRNIMTESQQDLGALEPYFKFNENLRPIPFLKYCIGLKMNSKGHLAFPSTTERELESRLPGLVLKNPQLKKLEVSVCMLRDPEETARFFATLILSSVEHLSFKLYGCLFEYPALVDKILELFAIPNLINESVRRLKILSNADTFSELCLKHFQNVQHVSVKPVNAEDVFKYQKNLSKLSIALIDKPFHPPPTVVSVESLEVLKIRGSILNFLSAYQFPKLKYLLFSYYCKEHNIFYGLETSNEPVEEDIRTLLPLFGLKLDERDEQELQIMDASKEYERHNSVIKHAKLFLLKLNRISPVLATKLPNLEGISIKILSYNGYRLKPKDFSLFFELCRNFPKLRYASVRCKTDVEEIDIKVEMLIYFSQCPSLRAAWFESNNCRIALYYNTINKKLEFSNQYSKRNVNAYFDGVNLKNFHAYKR